MPDHNTPADQVQQLRIQRQRLRDQIPSWTGSATGLVELNRQINSLTSTIVRLNMVDPDATSDKDDNS